MLGETNALRKAGPLAHVFRRAHPRGEIGLLVGFV